VHLKSRNFASTNSLIPQVDRDADDTVKPNMNDELFEKIKKVISDDMAKMQAKMQAKVARAVATSCLSKMTCTRVSAQLEREMYQLTDDTSRAPDKTRAQEDNAESFHDECIPTANDSEEEDSLDGSEYDW
jgi:hypothetical protein